MTLRSQFTHNNQNSDGSLTNEQTMIENLIIESIQITGFHGYYLPRKMENIDPILGGAGKESFETAYELEMYFDAPEDAMADSVDYISYFGFEVRGSCDFVFSVKRFKDLQVPDPNRTDNRVLEVPLEGDLIYVPFVNQIFEIKFLEDWSPFFQLGSNYTYKALCRLFIYDHQDFDNLELRDSNGAVVDVQNMLARQTQALQQIQNIDEDNQITPFDDAQEFQTEGTTLLDFTEDNPFGEF